MRRAMEWSRGQKCLKNNIEHAGTVEVTVFPSRDGPVHSLNHKIKILYSPSQVYILIKKRESGFSQMQVLLFAMKCKQLFCSCKRSKNSLFLFGCAQFASLSDFFVLLSSCLCLILEHLCTSLSSLLLVDMLHQDTLVLENITLRLQIELVVHVLIKLVSLAIFGKETTENAHASDPNELHGHTCVSSTLSLTSTGMTTFSTGFNIQSCACPRMNSDRFSDDQTVLDETSNLVPRVGISNVGVLVRVEPYFVFAAFHNGSGEALLKDQGAHDQWRPVLISVRQSKSDSKMG